MNKKDIQTVSITQIAFLSVIGITLFFVITIFLGLSQNGTSLTQVSIPSETKTTMITPSPSATGNPAYPGPESTQTVAAAVTRKAVLYATYLAYTPEVSTPALYPTGIFNDPDIYDTG